MNEVIRIFVGAPSDVNSEREIIKKVINNINDLYRGTEYPQFDIVEIERDVRSDIGSGLEAQEVIDSKVNGNYDVFIGILWKKFGTPTKKYESGTEQEFENALKSNVKVMFYFSKLPFTMDDVDPFQLEKILNFKKSIQNKGFYFEYNSLENFENLIRDNLRILAIEKYNAKDKELENDGFDDDGTEEKSMFDLMEVTLNNFKEIETDANDLSELFDVLNEDFNNIAPPTGDDLQSYKIYSNKAADILNELSVNFKDGKDNLINHYSEGINNLIKLLELYGNYMDDSTRKEIEIGINSNIYVLNDFNKQMQEIITLYDQIPPVTKKLIRSKNNFINNIKELLKDVKNLRGLLYNSLIELNDSDK